MGALLAAVSAAAADASLSSGKGTDCDSERLYAL